MKTKPRNASWAPVRQFKVDLPKKSELWTASGPRIGRKKPAPGPACTRCVGLALEGCIRFETVLPVAKDAWAPLARDGSGKCCFDCASADGLMSASAGLDFVMARIAVGNDRQQYLRLPVVMHGELGLAKSGLMKVLDLTQEQHHKWLDQTVPGWDSMEFMR